MSSDPQRKPFGIQRPSSTGEGAKGDSPLPETGTKSLPSPDQGTRANAGGDKEGDSGPDLSGHPVREMRERDD